MKKQLTYAMLGVCVIGFNAMPAKASNKIVDISIAQITNNVKRCWHVPHLGWKCW